MLTSGVSPILKPLTVTAVTLVCANPGTFKNFKSVEIAPFYVHPQLNRFRRSLAH